MIPIIFEKGTTTFSNNGLGRLRDCISCVVTEERNGIYECDFEYQVDGANFELIQPGRIICVTHDDNGDIQPFDIVGFSKPLDGIVTFHCTHVSYRLNKAVTYSKNKNSLSAALTQLSGKSPSPFTFSADFTASGYVASFDGVPKTLRQYLGGVEGSILDTFGGEYEFNVWDVILHKNRGERKDFAIRYGVNLLDYTNDTDYSETFNYGVPYWCGQNDKGNNICVVGTSQNNGSSFIGQALKVPVDLSDRFETKPTAAQLEAEVVSYMKANNTAEPEENIQIDFVRLQDFEDYDEYANLLTCKLCDSIRVIFPQYNEDRWLKIVKIEYDVLSDRYNTMELGKLSTTLADALGLSNGDKFKEGVALDSLLTTTQEDTSTGSITATTDSGDKTATFTKAGYYPIGIVGLNVGGTNRMYANVYEYRISSKSTGSCTVTYRFRNNASVAVSLTVYFDILWAYVGT